MPIRTISTTASDVLGSPIRNLVSILVYMGVVFVLAVFGYREAGWSWGDAIYMVTLTIYSVGYQEVRPIDTPYLHALTIGLMVLGCTGMILLTGALVQVFTVLQLRQMLGLDRMKTQIEKLENHVIICGFGRIGVMLAKDLAAAKAAFVILERDARKITEAEALGFLCVAGDATEEQALRDAGIDRARVLATVLPDDAANVFITLSARSLNRTIEIIARGEAPTTESKLVHAGADRVVLPTHIGAERIAEMILFPQTADFLRDVEGLRTLKRNLGNFGLAIEVARAIPGGTLTGLTVSEAEKRGAGGFLIVRIDRKGGKAIHHPGPETRIEADDAVALVVRDGNALAGAMFGNTAGPMRVGRSLIG
jgi:voltage-gated potassium channel